MITMAKRNIKLFFRDKSEVFFSLLAVFIIIGLYLLFLKDSFNSDELNGLEGKDQLIASWLMAGIVAVASVTTTLGAFGTMVSDRANKLLKDFYTSPAKRSSIAGGYILSGCAIGMIMSLITLIAAEVYLKVTGVELLSPINMLKMLGIIVLSVLSSSSMVFFLVSFFKSQNAFATASTIIGTLIGFITGVYIPIGTFPEGVQLVVKLFPTSHAGALMRQLFLEKPLEVSFANVPADAVDTFKESMGVFFRFGDTNVSELGSILVLLASIALFYGLSVLNLSRKNK